MAHTTTTCHLQADTSCSPPLTLTLTLALTLALTLTLTLTLSLSLALTLTLTRYKQENQDLTEEYKRITEQVLEPYP